MDTEFLRRVARTLGRYAAWCGLVGLFLAGAGAVFAWSLWSTVERQFQAAQVTVPSIIGMTPDDATVRLQKVGLELEIGARITTDAVDVGLVATQDPGPGIGSRKGRSVVVEVSAGTTSLASPDLLKMSRREATIALRNQKLTLGEVLSAHSSQPVDTVIAQVPLPGTIIDPGGKVDLLVSLGPGKIEMVMPDVRGQRYVDVERSFDGAGLRIAEVKEQFAPGAPDGTVQLQSPAPGTRTSRDVPVRLVVSRVQPIPTSVAPPGGREP
jgi:beta-lactam-binding protein with PASTA domain